MMFLNMRRVGGAHSFAFIPFNHFETRVYPPLTRAIAFGLSVTSRKVVWLFLEQVRLQFVPVLHRLQGRLAAQG